MTIRSTQHEACFLQSVKNQQTASNTTDDTEADWDRLVQVIQGPQTGLVDFWLDRLISDLSVTLSWQYFVLKQSMTDIITGGSCIPSLVNL